MGFFIPILFAAFVLPSSVVAQSNSSLVYNVLDYGAVGDGYNDDTNVMLNLLAQLFLSLSLSLYIYIYVCIQSGFHAIILHRRNKSTDIRR